MMSGVVEKFKAYLKRKGMKVTRERVELVEWIFANEEGEHFNADGLLQKMKNSGKNVSRATIYRTLELLAESELLSTMILEDKTKYYELCLENDEHDHLICVKCGKIIEFSDDAVHDKLHAVAEKHGYKIIGHHSKINGVCPECSSKN